MSAGARIMAHMVAFYPDGPASLEVARGLAEGGCAYLEVQFPFSDPTADGPDIQKACSKALEAGFDLSSGFRLLAGITASAGVPVFLMSYANLPFTRGLGAFLRECRSCGVRGVIIPDLPPGYDEGLFSLAREIGLAAVPLASPSMGEDRLRGMTRMGTEYLYATLRSGTTGAGTRIDGANLGFLRRIKELSGAQPPRILGGFGIASREQVEALAPHVHAVVAGSVFVRRIAEEGDPYDAVRGKMEELSGKGRRATPSPRSP